MSKSKFETIITAFLDIKEIEDVDQGLLGQTVNWEY